MRTVMMVVVVEAMLIEWRRSDGTAIWMVMVMMMMYRFLLMSAS